MKRSLVLCLTAALLLSTTHRTPAPIVEESPTPASVKPKAKGADSESPKKRQTPSRVSPSEQRKVRPQAVKLAGTYKGDLNISGMAQEYSRHSTFVIPPAENLVQWTDDSGTKSYPATVIGNTISWKAGPFSLLNCTLTLIGDGSTAKVTMTSSLGNTWGMVKRLN